MSEIHFPALDAKRSEYESHKRDLANVFEQAGGLKHMDLDRVTVLKGTKADKLEWIAQKERQLSDLMTDINHLKQAQAAYGHAVESVESDDSGRAEDLGSQFVKSAAFKGWNRGANSGPAVTLKADFERTAGWEPESVRESRIAYFPTNEKPGIIDFIPQSSINQAVSVHMEETTFSANAAERAEKATYAEGELELTQRTQPVEKITIWLPVTDEQLEDVDQARAYVNQRLMLMLAQRLNRQVLAGNGVAPNLRGTESVPSINSLALASGETLVDRSLELFDLIRTVGYAEPSIAFMRPDEWSQHVATLTTSDGQYIWGHPSSVGPKTLWGVPVHTDMSATAGKLVTGDYQQHAALKFKRGVDMQVTNSHANMFTSGMQAIRADLRAVMVHYRVPAFGELTGL